MIDNDENILLNRKHSGITSKENIYTIESTIDNIALVSSSHTGKSGLVNIRNNILINKLDYYETIRDKEEHFFYLKKTVEIEDDTSTVKRNSEKMEIISIYDTLKEDMIFDDCEVIESDTYSGFLLRNNFIVVKSFKDGKYYIFDNKLYRKSSEFYKKGYDKVEKISEYSFMLISGNKKGIYRVGVGLTADIEYDDIEYYNSPSIILLTKGNIKNFNVDVWSNKNISSDYDNIRIKKIEETIFPRHRVLMYCVKDSEMSVFSVKSALAENELKLLFKVNSDDIHFLSFIKKSNHYSDFIDGEYFFKTIKNGKYGLIKCVIEGNKISVFKELSEPIYDDITFKDRTYFLYKDGKVGILYDGSIFTKNEYIHNTSSIESKYDNIQRLDDGFYILHSDNKLFIAKINDLDNHVIEFDELVCVYKNTAVYIRDGEYGIFSSSKNKTYGKFGYDSIVHRGGGYFEVSIDGKKGIWFDNRFIMAPRYVSIDLHGDYMSNYRRTMSSSDTPEYTCNYLKNDNKIENSEYIFFSLGTKYFISGKIVYQLIRRPNDGSTGIEMVKPIDKIFKKADKIEFLENVIVVRGIHTHTYIYNYKGELAMTLPLDAKISYIQHINKQEEPNADTYTPIYMIDGEYYFYMYGTNTFKKTNIVIDDTPIYMSAYETEYGTIVVNSYAEEDHDRKCKDIERLSLDEVDSIILDDVSDNEKLLSKYPKLIRKR